jgi:glycosyltransferase involved in cell wall biosynthesis
MKIKLLSNMYPSREDQLFGVFVKKTVEVLEGLGANFTSKTVIKGKRNSRSKKTFTYTAYYFRAMISIFNNRHDLVYIHFLTHNLPLIWWYHLIQKKPIVVNLHGSDINKVKKDSKLDQLQGKTLKRVDEVVVPSNYFKNILQQRYPHFNSRIFVYPSGGIDLELFKPSLKVSKENQLVLSFVSRIDKGKGWEDFLEIIDKLNTSGIDTKAIVAGDGSEKKLMQEAINNHPYAEKVEFYGFQPKQELPKIYQASEIFIFPTQLPESLGLVGLEAMACGNIVFARNIGGATGYIQSGYNGFLFNSVEEVIQQIQTYLLLKKEEKAKLKNNAIETSKKYDSQKVALDLYNNFKKICSKN